MASLFMTVSFVAMLVSGVITWAIDQTNNPEGNGQMFFVGVFVTSFIVFAVTWVGSIR